MHLSTRPLHHRKTLVAVHSGKQLQFVHTTEIPNAEIASGKLTQGTLSYTQQRSEIYKNHQPTKAFRKARSSMRILFLASVMIDTSPS